MTPRIIGLVGRKRSGKDTIAARLVEAHGFVRMAFADNLRTALLALDPLVCTTFGGEDGDAVWYDHLSELVAAVGWEAAKSHPEVRRLLQHYGTAIRDIQHDFWVAPVIFAAAMSEAPVVITDVRFGSEAYAVEKHGGRLVRVERPGQDMSDTHVSEVDLDDRETWQTLTNSGSVADLHEAVDMLIAAD